MGDHYYAVIMAGGGGTRLWPLSRQAFPKQMLNLEGGRTLFQMAVDRLQGLIPHSNILVVTVRDQAEALMSQCPEIPKDNYILEPKPRGTASVVGLAAVVLKHRDPEAIMAVLTADHYIQNVALFHELLWSARAAAKENLLVTLGIQPTYPSTGYGYIQKGGEDGVYENNVAYRVVRFTEKPDLASAKDMLKRGDHNWNSGMFIWKVDAILEEINRLMPELFAQLGLVEAGLTGSNFEETLSTVWQTIKPQTIDYGIMEKARNVVVLEAKKLGWNDVGSWESLFEVLPADENGNIIMNTQHLGLETSRSLLASENKECLLVTIGVKDLIIVNTGNAILVCHREKAQSVREIVDRLQANGKTEYL